MGLLPGNKICDPLSGNVWAADSQNASVKEYKAPLSAGESPSLMLGGFYLSSSALNAPTFGAGTPSSSSTASGGIPEFPFQLAAVTAFTLLTLGAYALTRRRGGTRTWHAAGPLRLRFGP